jgi:hypothetical protein
MTINKICGGYNALRIVVGTTILALLLLAGGAALMVNASGVNPKSVSEEAQA